MNADDFYVAKQLEKDGWSYEYLGDDGDMVFTRILTGVTYQARVRAES